MNTTSEQDKKAKAILIKLGQDIGHLQDWCQNGYLDWENGIREYSNESTQCHAYIIAMIDEFNDGILSTIEYNFIYKYVASYCLEGNENNETIDYKG